MSRNVNISCIQICSKANIQDNLPIIDSLSTDAKKNGADFLFFPENAFLMDYRETATPDKAFRESEHPALNFTRNLAHKLDLWIHCGSIAVKDNSGKVYNRSYLIDEKGNIVSYYDKIHLFDVQLSDKQTYKESNSFSHGSRCVVSTTPWGKIGHSICYDLRFPHLYREMAKKGAEIIVIPAAFTYTTGRDHWHILIRARAIENGCFVVAAAQHGAHEDGRKTYGHSLIVNPWGSILADGKEGNKFIMANIDIDLCKKIRRSIPSLTHDQKFEVIT